MDVYQRMNAALLGTTISQSHSGRPPFAKAHSYGSHGGGNNGFIFMHRLQRALSSREMVGMVMRSVRPWHVN